MNDKPECQVSTEDNTSTPKKTSFGDKAHLLWSDTIAHVAVQLQVCVENLNDPENRQYSDTVSDTLDILRSCLKSLELLHELDEDASKLRDLL